jgi:hypothetical protein
VTDITLIIPQLRLRRGKSFASRVPTARDTIIRVPRPHCRPLPAAAVPGAATSDVFDSPQRSEDYRDVSEKRAPTRSCPPACRRRSGPRPQGLCPRRRGCHFEQPDPSADSRGLRDPRRPRRLWGSRPRPPAPHQSTAVLSGMEGWRHLDRAEGPTSWGAIALARKDFRPARGLQAL